MDKLQTQEQMKEKRAFYDPALEALLNPDLKPQIKALLQQVKTGILDEDAAEEQIMQLFIEVASKDQQTDLYKAQAAEIKLGKVIEYCKTKNVPLTVAFLDGKNFRETNNQLGYQQGNTAISIITEAIKLTKLRTTDIFGPVMTEQNISLEESKEEPDARMGGDEFMIVFAGTDLQQAAVAINRFQKSLSALSDEKFPLYRETFGVPLSAHIGLTQYDPNKDHNAADLISRAEQNMRSNKAQSASIDQRLQLLAGHA